MLRLAYASLFSATLVGCAADPVATGASGGGKADGDLPTITFAGDFTESQQGDLLAGDGMRIAYDLGRLAACHAESNGSDVWGASGSAQFDDAAPVTFAVSRLDRGRVVPVVAELQVPASATRVQLWFTVSNTFGCVAYDSNSGQNYAFDIDRHGLGAVLGFDADGTQSQSAAIHAGDQVVVHYDPQRLATCAGSTGGHAAWGITGHWQVDGGTVHDVMVSRADGSTLVAADPTITIPRGHDLALWFEATSVWGCHAWDSANGANYHATIE